MLGMLLLFFITVTITGYTKYFDLKKKNKKIKEPLELTNLSAGGDFKISIKQLDHQSRYKKGRQNIIILRMNISIYFALLNLFEKE